MKILYGGHWSDNPGWNLLTEADQDITKKLKAEDNSTDCVFTEHVLEHIEFHEAIDFFKEAYRILKPGGVIRTVCPMIDTLIKANLKDDNGVQYVKSSLLSWFSVGNQELNNLGLNGLYESPEAFLFNSMFTKHGHKFIWSSDLMIKVLKAAGFSSAYACEVGQGANPDYCIERRARGIYGGRDWEEDRKYPVYDCESGIVEAIK